MEKKMFYLVVMSEDMAKDGYEDIMNIDISSVAINMMKTRNKHIPQLKCILLKTSLLQFYIVFSMLTWHFFFMNPK